MLQAVLVFPSVSAISLQEYIADRRLSSADKLTVDGVSEGSAVSSEGSASAVGVTEGSAVSSEGNASAVGVREGNAVSSEGSASVVGVREGSAVSSDGNCMTFVFIDCTWYQVHRIATDPRLSSKLLLLRFWSTAVMKFLPQSEDLGI